MPLVIFAQEYLCPECEAKDPMALLQGQLRAWALELDELSTATKETKRRGDDDDDDDDAGHGDSGELRRKKPKTSRQRKHEVRPAPHSNTQAAARMRHT